MNRVKGLIFLVIFGLLCIVVVVQTTFKAQEIKIPTDKQEEIIWDVVFEPDQETNDIVVEYTDGIKFTMPQLFDTIVNDFDVEFDKPKKEITYTFNLVNKSEYDAYILHYNEPTISCLDDDELCKTYLDKIEYVFMYEAETKVKLNDVLKAKEEKAVIINIKYKSNKEEIPMNLTKLGFNLTFAKVK